MHHPTAGQSRVTHGAGDAVDANIAFARLLGDAIDGFAPIADRNRRKPHEAAIACSVELHRTRDRILGCFVPFERSADRLAHSDAASGAAIGAIPLPIGQPLDEIGLVKPVPLGQAIEQGERHRCSAGPFSRPHAELAAAMECGVLAVAVPPNAFERRAQRAADRKAQHGAPGTLADILIGLPHVMAILARKYLAWFCVPFRRTLELAKIGTLGLGQFPQALPDLEQPSGLALKLIAAFDPADLGVELADCSIYGAIIVQNGLGICSAPRSA